MINLHFVRFHIVKCVYLSFLLLSFFADSWLVLAVDSPIGCSVNPPSTDIFQTSFINSLTTKVLIVWKQPDCSDFIVGSIDPTVAQKVNVTDGQVN